MTSTAPDLPPDSYYTPARIDRWLREWPLLCSLAETPRSSRHYLTLEHQYLQGRPCPPERRLHQRGTGYHGDTLEYADVQSDLEKAWVSLKAGQRWSIEFLVVEHTMKGRLLWEMAEAWGSSVLSVRVAYERAVRMMAQELGWRAT